VQTFVGADGVETTIGDISRIVSLNGDLTEIIFALGLGDTVVGVHDLSPRGGSAQ
jgi:iron complex transport system substrate-binding protein